MRRLAAALLLAVLSAGCATSGPGSAPGSGRPTSAPASSPAPTTSLPDPPPEPTGPVRLKGVVERGVEPGCLVLRAGGKSYTLLQGADATPAKGVPLSVPVEVEATLLTGVASYCQQGTLLKVVRVSRT
jgi:hypothetical protein